MGVNVVAVVNVVMGVYVAMGVHVMTGMNVVTGANVALGEEVGMGPPLPTVELTGGPRVPEDMLAGIEQRGGIARKVAGQRGVNLWRQQKQRASKRG